MQDGSSLQQDGKGLCGAQGTSGMLVHNLPKLQLLHLANSNGLIKLALDMQRSCHPLALTCSSSFSSLLRRQPANPFIFCAIQLAL
jgi:hypothetical protein